MSSKSSSGKCIQAAASASTLTTETLDSNFESNDPNTLLINSSSLAAQRPNFEGITLIWYDSRIDKTEDTLLTAVALREINDYLILHSDPNECIEYMKMVQNEKIFLITSGKAVIPILQKKQQLKQLDSIFIFCKKDEKYQHLPKEYEIIVGIYRERPELIEAIKQSVELLQKQTNAFSFYKQHEEKATRDILKESAEFLWFQLFKDVLLQMPRSDKAKQELINFSREYYRGNQKEYKNIAEFEISYNMDKSIYWYTKGSFLYRLVNKALRTEDIGQLHLFRFFISDLSSKLTEIHKEKNFKENTIFMLYRGLKMEMDELSRLKENIGSVISTNGFLSTSHLKKVAIRFATQSTGRASMVPVLYEIECNLNTTKSIVFADIGKYSAYAQEQEVLFDVGSTFKIVSVTENKVPDMTVVKFIATDAGMELAQKYIDLNRKRNEETTPDILFGILLVQMGKYDQSLEYFKSLLEMSNKEIDKARVYSGMGSAYLCKSELDEAYKCAKHAYKLMIRTKQCRIKDSIKPMTVMGHILLRKEEYEKSLDFFTEVLEIRNRLYGQKHLDTAVALNHVGNVFYKMEEYEKASWYYEKSFDINVEKLPHVHLDIAANLNNIGLILWNTKRFRDHQSSLWKNENLNTMLTSVNALECFRESLHIRKQVLPADHNDIIQSLDNIIELLYEQNDTDGALKYVAEKLTLQKINSNSNGCGRLSRPSSVYSVISIVEKPNRWPEYAMREHGDRQKELSIRQEPKLCRNILDDLEYERGNRILNNFIDSLKNGNDYTESLQAVNEVFIVNNKIRCKKICLGPLMKDFQNLVKNAYDWNDTSNEAIRFYIKVWLILSNWSCVGCVYTQQAYDNTSEMCTEKVDLRQEEFLSVLQNIIETFKNNSDYRMIIKAVKEILKTFSENLSQTYDHTKYLMKKFRDLLLDAYGNSDISNKAVYFYIKVLSILDNWSSRNCSKARKEYADAYKICTAKVRLRQKKDLHVLQDFIGTIKNNGDYHIMTQTVKEVLTTFSMNTWQTYSHSEYLITHFRGLIRDAYSSTDQSNEAFLFYIRVLSILNSWSGDSRQDRLQYYDPYEKRRNTMMIMQEIDLNECQYPDINEICMERMRVKQKKDLSVLQELIETIKNNGDPDRLIKVVEEILTAFPENLFQSYNHNEYLMTNFHDLVRDAYNITEQSNEAIRFYEGIRLISEKKFPCWVETSDIQIICNERVAYAHQLNGNYQLGAEYLQNSVKIEREKKKSLSNTGKKLYNIGLLWMIVGNYSLAVISFKEALKLLQPYSDSDVRRKRWILQRIGEVEKLSNH